MVDNKLMNMCETDDKWKQEAQKLNAVTNATETESPIKYLENCVSILFANSTYETFDEIVNYLQIDKKHNKEQWLVLLKKVLDAFVKAKILVEDPRNPAAYIKVKDIAVKLRDLGDTEPKEEKKTKPPEDLQHALWNIKPSSPTDQILEILEWFVDENPMFFDTKTKIWWLWHDDSKRWEISSDEDILRLFKNRYSFTEWLLSGLKAQLLTGLQVCAEKKPINVPPEWIQFKNKAINLISGEEKEPTPEMFWTNPILWDIADTDETPILDKIFEDWVGKNRSKTLFEVTAYTLYRSYPIHRIFFFVGAGLNGKTTYLELMSRFVGEKNRISTDLVRLKESRFESAKLLNKLICEISETSADILSDAAILKAMTGETYLPGEFKQKESFEFKSFAKLFFSTNNLPVTADTSDGFYRRACVFEFPNQFNEVNNFLDIIPPEEYQKLARKCINILKELLKTMKFTDEGSISDRRTRYETASNPIRNFIEEYCIEELGGYITKTEFKTQLSVYLAAKKHYKKFTTQQINKVLRHMGIENAKQTVKEAKNPLWVLSGIRFKTDEELTKTSKIMPLSTLFSYTGNLVEKHGYIGNIGTEAQPTEHNNPVISNLGTKTRETIIKLLEQLEQQKEEVAETEFIDMFEESGRQEIQTELDRMKNEGLLFEPHAGFIKRL